MSRFSMTNEVVVEIFPWLSRALQKESKVLLTEKVNPKGEQLKSVLERIAVKHEGFGAMIYDVTQGTVFDNVVLC